MQKTKRIENRALLDLYHAMCCIVCGIRGCDPCHIKTRGSGGDDVPNNLIAMCRAHHTEQGSIGWRKFAIKYPKIGFILYAKGWTIAPDGRLSIIAGFESMPESDPSTAR